MVKRIAVLRALQLGDFLCAEPALRALHERFPLAELSLIALPWMEPFIRRYTHVSRLLPFPGYPGIEEVPFHPQETEGFLAAARADDYDLAVQMHGSGPESNAFLAELGAQVTLGYTEPGVPAPLTLAVPYPGDGVHEVRKWLGLVAHVGATGAPSPQLPVFPEERAQAAELLAGLDPGKPIVALHTGSREAARRWEPARFAALADRLHSACGCQILLTGTARDAKGNARTVAAAETPIVDLAGRTGIGTLAALLDRVDLLVTNDSGPSHVAWARGVPSVVLFGPTNPVRWAPLPGGLHHAVVSPSHSLQDLPVERVLPAALAMFERAQARRCGP